MRMSSHSQALDPMIGIGGKRGILEQDLNSLEEIAWGRHSRGCEDAHSCLPSMTHSFHTSSAKNDFSTNESQKPQNRLPVAEPIRMQPWLSSLLLTSFTSSIKLSHFFFSNEYNKFARVRSGQTYPIHPH